MTQFDTLEAVLEQPIPPVGGFRDDAPPGIDRILGKVLARDPDERYQRGAELQHDLEPLLGPKPLPARPASRPLRRVALDYALS